jgi:hypothetical protein
MQKCSFLFAEKQTSGNIASNQPTESDEYESSETRKEDEKRNKKEIQNVTL